MKLRRGMEVTTNIRPVRYYSSLCSFSPLKETILSKGLDFVFVRDIRGGVLCSDKIRTQGEEGTQMIGTPYLYASAELAQDGRGIYTPNQLHHPDESIIGKQLVNPIGMIMAGALMMRYTFKMEDEAAWIERAVEQVLQFGYATIDIYEEGKKLVSTSEMAEKIAERIKK